MALTVIIGSLVLNAVSVVFVKRYNKALLGSARFSLFA